MTAHLRAALAGALRGAVVGAAAAEHLAAVVERDAAEAAHAVAVGYRERHAAMARLHTSPLGAELDAARERGRDEVIELVMRRRRAVRATRLPGDERARAFRRAVAEMFTDMDLEVTRG